MRFRQTQITDFISGGPLDRDATPTVEQFSVPQSKEKEAVKSNEKEAVQRIYTSEAVSHVIIVYDLFQKKYEVFEQITSQEKEAVKSNEKEAVSHNIMVCDLFQKKDEVLEQITSEDENENEEPGEEYYLTSGVQEQQRTLPTKPTSEEGKEGLMVLEKEDSKPEEHE